MNHQLDAPTDNVSNEIKQDRFKKELEGLLNKYSIDNDADTPDFILAEFVCRVISVYCGATGSRDTWFSFDPKKAITGND